MSIGLKVFAPWIKQPTESRVYSVDFTKLLDTNDSLAGVISVTTNQTNSGLTIGSPTISGKTVRFRLSGGTTGYKHKLTIIVSTSMGDTIEGDVYLKVIAL